MTHELHTVVPLVERIKRLLRYGNNGEYGNTSCIWYEQTSGCQTQKTSRAWCGSSTTLGHLDRLGLGT